MTELGPVLSRLGLFHYLDRFIEEGFDTWETLLEVTESDLNELDVKLGHRRRLQREISIHQGLGQERSPTSPAATSRPENNANESSADRHEGLTGTGATGKRKYRRHAKSDPNAPVRPPSAYVIFSNKIRDDLKAQSLTFTDIAKYVGQQWQLLNRDGKEPYEMRAAAAKEKYRAELTEYKKTDSYQEYVEYLADFKAKTSTQNQATKRHRLDNDPSTGSNEGLESPHDVSYPSGGSSVLQNKGRPWLDSTGSAEPHLAPGASRSPAAMIRNAQQPSKIDASIPVPADTLPSQSASPAQTYTYPVDMQGPSPVLARRSQSRPRAFSFDSLEPQYRRRKVISSVTDTSMISGRRNSRSRERTSRCIGTSLAHQDSSGSSLTSRSSDTSQFSNASIASSNEVGAVRATADESRNSRSLPAPPNLLMKPSFIENPIGRIPHTLYPPITSSLPSLFLPVSSQRPQHGLRAMPPSSQDLCKERHSLKELSIASVGVSESERNLRNRSRPARESQEYGSAHPYHGSKHMYSSSQTSSPALRKSRPSLSESSRHADMFRQTSMTPDPLSVLAYAGRIVDRGSYDPSPSPNLPR